jgi:hypothetical protein
MFNGSKFLQKLWNGRTRAQPNGAVPLDERTIAIGQIWQQVSVAITEWAQSAINERDPEDWNAWHWLQDLYFDPTPSP